MNKYFRNTPLLLSMLTSFIYLIAAITICIKTKSNISGYIAALLPFIVIIISSLLSIRFSFVGGLLLLTEGGLILYFILINFKIMNVIGALIVFGLPIISSGLILIFKSFLAQKHYQYNLSSIHRFFY